MSPKILDEHMLLAREEEMLSCSLAIIQRSSVSDLTIDQLVKELPYSKGTVYNHFTCKEDLLLALSNQGMKRLMALFEKAATFEGNSREKGLAIHFAYMLYAKLFPTNFLLVISAMSSNVMENASEQRLQEHSILESQLLGTVANNTKTALENGDCNPAIKMTPEQIIFACWSMGFGTNVLLKDNAEYCSTRSSLIVEQQLLDNVNLVYDGLRWKPLSYEHDWSETITRLKQQTFANEIKQLDDMGKSLAI